MAGAVVEADREIHMQKTINQAMVVAVTFTFILIFLNIYALSQLTGKVPSVLDVFRGYPVILVRASVLQDIQQPSAAFSTETWHVMANAC